MTIDPENAETLFGVLQSYLAATGEPFDQISCPKLAKAWKALKNAGPETPTTASLWINSNCKFAQSKDAVTFYDKNTQEPLISHQPHLGVFIFSKDHPPMVLNLTMGEMESLLRKIKIHTGRDCSVVFE